MRTKSKRLSIVGKVERTTPAPKPRTIEDVRRERANLENVLNVLRARREVLLAVVLRDGVEVVVKVTNNRGELRNKRKVHPALGRADKISISISRYEKACDALNREEARLSGDSGSDIAARIDAFLEE